MGDGSWIGATDRLILRQFTPDEAAAFFALNADPEVLRYTGDQPFASVDAARRFLAGYDPYSRSGFGRWSVYLRATGEYLGWSGLKYREDSGEVDLGYRFARRHWHQGYATESARFALAYGFDGQGLARIVAHAMLDNTRSFAVMARLGMTFERDGVTDGVHWRQYEITRERYVALRSSPTAGCR